MQNSVAKKIFAVGLAASTAFMALAPFAAQAAAHSAGTNVLSSDGTVWMITLDGMRRPYTSAGAFLSYGFNSFGTVVNANADDLALPAGSFIPPQDGKVICSDRGTDKGTCYLITGGMKAGFTSESVFTGLGYSFSRAQSGDVSFMNTSANIDNTTAAHRPGTLVHFSLNGNDTVFLVGATGLLGIPTFATFTGWGYAYTDVVVANAADQAMTQTGVMAPYSMGLLSPTALTNVPPTPGVVNGSVSASLSSDTPAAGTLVANSNASNPGQTGADLAHFNFSGSGTVTQVIVKRIGVSSDSSINNVYLYMGNNRITDAGSFSNGQVTFSNSNGLFTVSGSVTISVKVDVAPGASSGQTLGAQLSSYSVANGSPMTTSISGNLMTLAAISNLATVAVTFPTGSTLITSAGATGGAAGTINAGTMNTVLWSAPISVGQRAVMMKYIAFKQIGSVSQSAIQNLRLYVDGAAVGSASSITNIGGNTNVVAFDVSGSPVSLNTGNHTLELHGDIIGGTSYNYNFTVQTASDVVFYDPSYNVNVPFTYSGGANSIFQLSPGVTTVNSGTITVQSDPTFTPTQFVKNASQVTLGQWTIKAYGEDVKVQSLKVVLNYTGIPTNGIDGFNNLSIFVNGGQVGSSQSAIGSASSTTPSYTFGTTNLFTVPAGTTVTVAVKGDSVLTASSVVTAVRADLVTTASSLQGVTSFSLSPSSDITYTGRPLTVSTSAATLTSNSGFSNQTVSSNIIKQKIGSYVIQASNADGVRVTSLTVTFPGGSNNTINPTTTLANLYIVTPQGTATPVAPQASNNFSVNFTVGANQTATVDVFADVSNSTGKVMTALNGTGSGATSNQSVSLPSSGVTNGQVVTVGNGTPNAPTLQTSAAVSQFVISGTQNQPSATFNFVANGGGLTITELYFMVATSSGATSIPVTTVNVGAVGGSSAASAPVIYTGTTPNGATSTVTGLNIAVPTSFGGIDVPVTVNLANVGLNGIATNQIFTLKLTGYKYVSGGTTTTSYISPVSANNMDLVGGAPVTVTVTQSSQSTLIGGGSSNMVGKITITANSAGGNIVLSTLPLTFGSGGGAVVASGSDVTLYDELTGANVTSSTLGWGLNAGASSSTTVTLTNKNTITAGTSRTYAVYVPVSGTFGTAPAATISLQLGAATAFTFNDVNGGLNGIAASQGGVNFIVSYPTTSVAIHN